MTNSLMASGARKGTGAMTTNQKRAENLMVNARNVVSFKQLAQALADAGLIAPDPPKVVWPGSSLSVSGESETLSVETEESEGCRDATALVDALIAEKRALMSDLVQLIDGDGHVVGWCRSVSPPFDRGDHVVVQLDEWEPHATK